jgi:FkbM family methyltransferase
MPKDIRKIIRKYTASFLKRFYILTNDGYSVGSAYGARFLFDWRHSLDKKVALEIYERNQITYLVSALDKIRPDMFIDIGSHAALYSIIIKTQLTDLEVHAFEPDRTNLCQLYANLFLNNLQSSIRVHEYGLSDISGTTKFETSVTSSSRGTRRISHTGNTEIQVKPLDDALTDRGRVAAIKIDVEGHEQHVVAGAEDFLRENKCFLQIESSPNDLEQLQRQLSGLGYRYITKIHDHYFTNFNEMPDGI